MNNHSRQAQQRVHELAELLNGVLYRVLDRRPDPQVSDAMLAERVRSQLNPLTNELHLPDVLVNAVNHVVILHGDVPADADAKAIEDAAGATAGVHGVVSLLDAGTPRSDIRRCYGRPGQQSDARRRLLAAARGAGCPQPVDHIAVRTVLAIFFEHLPEAEATEVMAQLPVDVQRLTIPPNRTGPAASLLPNTLNALVGAVAGVVRVPGDTAHEVVVTVLQALRKLLPEELRSLDAFLPNELRNPSPPVPASALATGNAVTDPAGGERPQLLSGSPGMC